MIFCHPQNIPAKMSKSIEATVRYTVRMKRKKHNPNPAGKEGLPVSLHPLSFDEAVAGLAQTKMPEQKEKPKAPPKKGNG